MKITKEDIGKKVWCKKYGEGHIVFYSNSNSYPVCVGFNQGQFVTYTVDGSDFQNLKNDELDLSWKKGSKKVKRYWRWLVKFGCWRKQSEYLDEDGKSTSYTQYFQSEWNNLLKKKLDDEWIEIDENDNIVATSYDKED